MGVKKYTRDDDHKSEVKRPAMRQKLLDPMEVIVTSQSVSWVVTYKRDETNLLIGITT